MTGNERRTCCDSTINEYHADDCKGRLRADYYFGPYEPTHTEKLLERIATALEKLVTDVRVLDTQVEMKPFSPVPEDTHAPGTTRATWCAPELRWRTKEDIEDAPYLRELGKQRLDSILDDTRCRYSWWRAGSSGRVRCDYDRGHAGPHIHNS